MRLHLSPFLLPHDDVEGRKSCSLPRRTWTHFDDSYVFLRGLRKLHLGMLNVLTKLRAYAHFV